MDSCKANLVLGNFAKKLGFGQTPPLVGKKSQLLPFFLSEGSPFIVSATVHIQIEFELKLARRVHVVQ